MTASTNPGAEDSTKKYTSLKQFQKLTLKDRLIKERELSDLIINCLPGIFYLQDQFGTYLRWNKNFEIASGYSGEEIQRMHPLDFFDKKDHERMIEATRKVYEEGYNETEVEVVAKDGNRYLYFLNGVSVTYEGKLCLLGTGIDLTPGKRRRKKLKKAKKIPFSF